MQDATKERLAARAGGGGGGGRDGRRVKNCFFGESA